MSKKNFTGGLNSLLGDQSESLVETTQTKTVPTTPQISKQLQKEIKNEDEKETRATFIVNENLLEKLKAMAYWERLLFKEIVNDALADAVAKYEKKNGTIKSVPKK